MITAIGLIAKLPSRSKTGAKFRSFLVSFFKRRAPVIPAVGSLWVHPDNLFDIRMEVMHANSEMVAFRIYTAGIPKQPGIIHSRKDFLRLYLVSPATVHLPFPQLGSTSRLCV